MPGGYCTAYCQPESCPSGSTCVDLQHGGEACLKRCRRDADCRAPEGYRCDASVHVCAPEDTLAPVVPACHAARPPRGRFSLAQQITDEHAPGRWQNDVSAAIDEAGDVVMTYVAIERLGSGKSLPLPVSILHPDGRVEHHVIPTPRRQHTDQMITNGRDGTVYLTWLGWDGDGMPEQHMQIGLTHTRDGVHWSTPIDVHLPADCAGDAPGCVDKANIATGPLPHSNQEAVYVAYGHGTDVFNPRVVRSVDGGAHFSAVADAPIGTIAQDLFVDGGGRVWIAGPHAWNFGHAGTSDSVRWSVSDAAATSFSAPHEIQPSVGVPLLNASSKILVDRKRGFVYLVYAVGHDGVYDIMLATSHDEGSHFSYAKVNDDKTCGAHILPRAVLDDVTGTVHVVWVENRDGRGGVAYAACDAGGARCGANESVSSTPFAAMKLSAYGASFVGDWTGLVLDRQRRLHAVWTQPVPEHDGLHDRIFHAVAALPGR